MGTRTPAPSATAAPTSMVKPGTPWAVTLTWLGDADATQTLPGVGTGPLSAAVTIRRLTALVPVLPDELAAALLWAGPGAGRVPQAPSNAPRVRRPGVSRPQRQPARRGRAVRVMEL